MDEYKPEMVDKILDAAKAKPVASFSNLKDYIKWQDNVTEDQLPASEKGDL